jgi:hypothetical protein
MRSEERQSDVTSRRSLPMRDEKKERCVGGRPLWSAVVASRQQHRGGPDTDLRRPI